MEKAVHIKEFVRKMHKIRAGFIRSFGAEGSLWSLQDKRLKLTKVNGGKR